MVHDGRGAIHKNDETRTSPFTVAYVVFQKWSDFGKIDAVETTT